MSERIEIFIEDYITQVMLSKKRKVKYTKTGKVSKTSGTPKYHKIAGNDLWASLNPHIRAKILKEIKLWFYHNYVVKLPEIKDFPISITFQFYGPLSDLDIDNLDIFYRKAFLDCLAGHVIQIPVKSDQISTGLKQKEWDYDSYPPRIPDDNVHFVRRVSSEYIESEKTALRKKNKKHGNRDESIGEKDK